MATVALINPQLVSSGWGRGLRPETMDDVLPRHSLLWLSGPLKQAGHRVELVDLRLLQGWADFDGALSRLAPDFAAVTAHTLEQEVALECLRRARRVVPGCVTVAGGIHFTMFPELGADEGLVDHVIRGEAELSLPRLVAEAAGWPRVSWGEPADLDRLPFPDRALYPDYGERIQFGLWELPTPLVDVLTSRGCPWACRFCCGPGEQNLFTKPSPAGGGRRIPSFRRRSVGNVIAELEELDERYRFRSVVFHDDQLVVQRQWVEELCEALHQRGFVARGVRWWAATRPDVVCRHPELIARMRRAGLEVISLGFESFSDPVLRWMGKGCTRSDNLRAAEICHGLGLKIFANVILGLPRPDGRWVLEDDLASLDAIRRIRPRHFSPSFFSPIPGSWFHDWALANDLVVAVEAPELGSRTPDQARIKGVDYGRLAELLAEYRARHDPGRPLPVSLKRRLARFLAKPLPDQLAAVRARLGRMRRRGPRDVIS